MAFVACGTKNSPQKENGAQIENVNNNSQVEYKEADHENIDDVMLADIAYCDDKILVFKDYFGLFVYSFDEKRIVSSIEVKYIDCDMNQGDNACTFNLYNNGEIIELNNQEKVLV